MPPADRDLREPDRTPVAWMITYDGEATLNVHLSEKRARDEMAHLDHHYPEHKRTIRPLYVHPVDEMITTGEQAWLDNLPSADEVIQLRADVDRPHVRAALERLRNASPADHAIREQDRTPEPSVEEARGRVLSQSCCNEDSAEIGVPEVHEEGRSQLVDDVDRLILAVRRDAANALLASLPPSTEDESLGAKLYREECDRMQAFAREFHVGGAMGYGGNVFELMRKEVRTFHALRDFLSPPSADTQRDAARYRALRPFLSVGVARGGRRWALGCIRYEDEEEIGICMYSRRPASDAEQARRDSGDPEWGPGVDEMVDEMITPTKEAP